MYIAKLKWNRKKNYRGWQGAKCTWTRFFKLPGELGFKISFHHSGKNLRQIIKNFVKQMTVIK